MSEGKQDEKPKEEPKKPPVGLQDGRQTPTYLVLKRIVLTTDHQEYAPGQIVDLSHLPQESIRHFIKAGLFATADGEPANVPAKTAEPCKNC